MNDPACIDTLMNQGVIIISLEFCMDNWHALHPMFILLVHTLFGITPPPPPETFRIEILQPLLHAGLQQM